MPSRPESAQPAFDTLEPAPKPSTRTVPTGAPLSSLSSAPMRPAMKPRRAEINRPATADPYASRPGSRAQTTSKPASSPRSVRSKASTPSSKPINAPRLRPHESGQAGTTRGKPKKLDLSKSKSHNDLQAASHARSDSDDSMAHQPSVHIHHADSPAPVVLESPPLSASHQPLLPNEQSAPSHDATPEPVEEPQPLSLEEPIAAAASPRVREPDAATPLRHSALASDPESVVRAQPEEMVIYEDPATPVAAEPETPEIARPEHYTPEKSPPRTEEPSVETAAQPPAPLETPVKNPALELAPTQGNAADIVNEVPRQSPIHRTPLRGSPSPSRNRLQATPSEKVTGVESVLPHEPAAGTPFERSANNENATAHLGKVPTPRSVAKPGALEEVPLNESTSRTVEARRQSFESLAQSTTSEEPFRRSRKWAERHRSPSPRSKDSANAREMLQKALTRIVSKTMDISGYRKLQGLFQYHGEEIVSRDQDYYAMLEALLKELEAAPTSRKDHDVKTQILATIRSMLLRTGELFHRYDIPAMATIIRARRHYESSSHFVTCLEEVVEQLVCLISAPTVIDGVLQGLELGEDAQSEDAYWSIIMGLATIHQALSQGPVEISDEVLASVGAVVSRQLGHPRPGVRKQATELCTLLNLKFGLERVQKVTKPAGEGSLNLLTYFMARHGLSETF